MNRTLITLLLVLTTIQIHGHPTASSENCDFYKEFKNPQTCLDDYVVNYGFKYCSKFLEERKKPKEWSEKAIKWSKDSSICLQEMLENNPKRTKPTCDQITDFAFDSHPVCYKQYNICDLSIEEKLKIFKIVAAEDVCSNLRRSLIQTLNVGISCFKVSDVISLLGASTFYRIFYTCAKTRVSKEFKNTAKRIIELMPVKSKKEVEEYFKVIFPEIAFNAQFPKMHEALSYYSPDKDFNRFYSLDPNYTNIEKSITLMPFSKYPGVYNSTTLPMQPKAVSEANKYYSEVVSDIQIQNGFKAAEKFFRNRAK